MSWLSKHIKKKIKVIDPAGAAIRKQTGGSTFDPLNWYDSKPKEPIPYERPPKMGLQPDPGTGGPTQRIGSSNGGYAYQPNPFAQQMAQADAVRGTGMSQPTPQPLPGGAQLQPGGGGPMMMGKLQQMQIPGQPINPMMFR